jgi:hypothetical protein
VLFFPAGFSYTAQWQRSAIRGAALLLVLVPVTVFGAPLPSAEQLRTCLPIEDGTKERLDCFDAMVPPEPMPGMPKAQTVLECRFLKEEDQRLACFNGFVAGRTSGTVTPGKLVQSGAGTRSVRPAAKPSAERKPTTDLKLKIDVVTETKTSPSPEGAQQTTRTTHHSHGGCGSRGGPGYRLANGKCASHHSSKHRR